MMAIAEDGTLAMIAGFHQANLLTCGDDFVLQFGKALQVGRRNAGCPDVGVDQFFKCVITRPRDRRKYLFRDAEDLATSAAWETVVEDAGFLLGRNEALQHYGG